jgi:hypothetical protein
MGAQFKMSNLANYNVFYVQLHLGPLGPFSVWGRSPAYRAKLAAWVKCCCNQVPWLEFVDFGVIEHNRCYLPMWMENNCSGHSLVFTISVSRLVRLRSIQCFMKTRWLLMVLSNFPIFNSVNTSVFEALVDVLPISSAPITPHPSTGGTPTVSLGPPTVWAIHQQCLLLGCLAWQSNYSTTLIRGKKVDGAAPGANKWQPIGHHRNIQRPTSSHYQPITNPAGVDHQTMIPHLLSFLDGA